MRSYIYEGQRLDLDLTFVRYFSATAYNVICKSQREVFTVYLMYLPLWLFSKSFQFHRRPVDKDAAGNQQAENKGRSSEEVLR